MLKQEQIEQLEQEIDQKQEEIESLDLEIGEIREAVDSLNEEAAEIEARHKIILSEVNQHKDSLGDKNVNKQQAQSTISTLKDRLEADAYEKKVAAGLDEQQSFEDALGARYVAQQQELNGGLELPGESKSFEDFLALFNQPGRNGYPTFNNHDVIFNSAKSAYIQLMTAIVEAIIQNGQVTPKMKRDRIIILDNLLRNPLIERMWAAS